MFNKTKNKKSYIYIVNAKKHLKVIYKLKAKRMCSEFGSENVNIFHLEPNEVYDQRCAEVFITRNKSFVFHCSLCLEKYAHFDALLEHILEHHYSGNVEIATEIPNGDISEDLQHDFNDLIEQVEESSAEDEVQFEEKAMVYEFVDLGRKSSKRQHIETTTSNSMKKEYSTAPSASDVFTKASVKNQKLSSAELQTMMKLFQQKSICERKDISSTTKQTAKTISVSSNKAKKISTLRANRPIAELQAMMKQLQQKVAAMRKQKAAAQTKTTQRKTSAVKQLSSTETATTSTTNTSKKRLPHSDKWSSIELQDMMQHLQQKNISKERKVRMLRMITNDYYSCKICDRKYKTKTMLKYHMITHSNVRPYKCEYCDLTFKTFSSVNAHQRRHTGIKNHDCSFCSKQFYTSNELETHVQRIHTGERNYICAKCGLQFLTSGLLNEHMKRHANYRPYKCEHCEKAFFSRDLLKKHLYVHSEEREHVCSICNASFARPRSLSLHMKIHINAREYNCDLCSAAFNQKQSLVAHKKSKHKTFNNSEETAIHHNCGVVEGITLCSQCNIKFADSATLLQHEQLVHNEQHQFISILT